MVCSCSFPQNDDPSKKWFVQKMVCSCLFPQNDDDLAKKEKKIDKEHRVKIPLKTVVVRISTLKDTSCLA